MITFSLPFPISVNAMFADGKTRRHKSQRYADWIIEAGYVLKTHRIKPIIGPVHLRYLLQEGFDNRRRDLGNYEKGVTDLLVEHGIIEADDGRIVREITLRWSKEETGIQVCIEPLVTEERMSA